MSRAGRCATVAAIAALLAGGCPRTTGTGGQGADGNDAVVKVRTPVADAALWFDGRFVGPAGGLRGGIAVEPGKHRLELRHDDYFSHYQDLELAPRQRLTLDIELAPVLP